MEWQDEGIVLSVTRHGESDAVVEAMTLNHGRARGFIKGGMGRRNKANIQAGNRVQLNWRSRIEANLGRFTVELLHSPLGRMLTDGKRLSALSAITAVVAASMPEREDHSSVYNALTAVLDILEHDDGDPVIWSGALVRLELGILKELGYGLDLSCCAATGVRENLIYVSPKTARAVSAEAGTPYRGKLLPLPAFLTLPNKQPDSLDEAIDGMTVTGFFLDRYIWIVHGKGQPAARDRLFMSLIKAARG